MEFVRQVISGRDLGEVLTLPPSFHEIQVEVIVLPINSPSTSTQSVKHSAYGRLKAFANPALIPEEQTAWEKAAVEKHALY